MTPFRRKPPRASTTPIADRMMRSTFLSSLLKVGVIVGMDYGAVEYFGLPALKFQYTYYGPKDSRIETECIYITFDGMQRYVPDVYEDRCPIIKLFPTKTLSLF